MKLDGSNVSGSITIRDGQSLSSRSRTTIENADAVADESCDQM